MKFTIIKDPIPFLIIDNTYTIVEQEKIYRELDFLYTKLPRAKEEDSAIQNGKMKKNTGIFLEEIYLNRNFSDILLLNRKLFSKTVCDALVECHYAYSVSHLLNNDSTLLSYYTDGDSYFAHQDRAAITYVTWFFKEPKAFTGGEFIFTDYNLDIEVKNNRTVVFLGSFKHEVKEVKINSNIPMAGRFTLTQFGISNANN
jgi:hypothetical protein